MTGDPDYDKAITKALLRIKHPVLNSIAKVSNCFGVSWYRDEENCPHDGVDGRARCHVRQECEIAYIDGNARVKVREDRLRRIDGEVEGSSD